MDNMLLHVIISYEIWHNMEKMGKKSDKCQPGHIIIAVSTSVISGSRLPRFEYSLCYWWAVWLKQVT